MSNLYVTELADTGNSNSGAVLQAGAMPPVVEQTPVVYTTSSVQSAVFNDSTKFVRVHTDAICHLAFGASPTATTAFMRMAADTTEYFAVKPGQRLAVIGIA